MTCDLSDPEIKNAYEELIQGDGEINWLVIGYRDTRDKLTFYAKGSGGVDELRTQLVEDVHYALLKQSKSIIYLTYVAESASGVRRARALVHGRVVAQLFSKHDLQFPISNPQDLTADLIQSRLDSVSPTSTSPPTDILSSNPPVSASLAPAAELAPLTPPTQPAPTAPTATLIPPAPVTAATAIETPRPQSSKRDTPLPIPPVSQPSAPVVAPSSKKELPPQPTKAKKNLVPDELLAKEKQQSLAVEELKKKLQSSEEAVKGKGLQGYITVQGGGSFLWKRRWFVHKDGSLMFYRDPLDNTPVSSLDLKVDRVVEDAQAEILIPHSFKVIMKDGKRFYFFADNDEAKKNALRGIVS